MKNDFKDTFRLLSIDGGGIKGLYSAIILDLFEKKYGPLAQYFDMISGTSTGAIIGTALAKGISAEDVVNFYSEKGPKILPSNHAIIRGWRLVKQIVFSSKYSNKALRKNLQSFIGDTVMDEAQCCLVISAVDLTTFKGFTFRTSHTGEYNPTGQIKMLDVTLASAAAPSYLPIVTVDGVSDYMVDGALWANNPVLMGIVEALKYFVGPGKQYKKISVLSIGNIDYNDGWSTVKPKRTSMLLWNKTLLSLALNTQTKAMEEMMEFIGENNLLKTEHYVRIANTGADSKIRRQIELDRTDIKPMAEISKLANRDGQQWKDRKEIEYFFTSKRRNYKFPI